MPSPSPRPKKTVKDRVIMIVLSALAAGALIYSANCYFDIGFIEQESVRSIVAARQDYLGTIAGMRAGQVDSWILSQKASLVDISQTVFVQRSLSKPGMQRDPIETQHFLAQAQQWIEAGRDPKILLKDRLGVMVLYDKTMRVEYAVPDGWQPAPVFTTVVQDAFKTNMAQFQVIPDENRPPLMVFAIPVFFSPDAATASGAQIPGAPPMAAVPGIAPVGGAAPLSENIQSFQQIGVLLAVKPLPEYLQTIIQATPARDKNYLTTLFQPSRDSALLLSGPPGSPPPGHNGGVSPVMSHRELDSATNFALSSPGIVSVKPGPAGQLVLVTGEVLKEAPWVVVATMPAPPESTFSSALNWAIFRLLLGFLTASLLASFIVWRSAKTMAGVSRKPAARAAVDRSQGGDEVLHVIADNLTQGITLFDRTQRLVFSNVEGARSLGKKPTDIIGRSMEDLLGSEQASRMKLRINEAIQARSPVIELEHQGSLNSPRIIQTTLIPVLNADARLQGAILVTSDDVTAITSDRERHESMLRQIIDTLVAIVDRRDPHAAGHSLYVGQIAHEIAETLNLDRHQVETAETAGLLMNFGKVLVPREILTKTSPLTPEELQQVRDSILASSDILSIIDFDQPIVPTLRQVLERVDGQGIPDNRKGDNIIITARIVAVANSFVALISSRAHRNRRGLDDALMLLEQEVGKAYDQRIVAALVEYINNRGGREIWSKVFEESALTDDVTASLSPNSK